MNNDSNDVELQAGELRAEAHRLDSAAEDEHISFGDRALKALAVLPVYCDPDSDDRQENYVSLFDIFNDDKGIEHYLAPGAAESILANIPVKGDRDTLLRLEQALKRLPAVGIAEMKRTGNEAAVKFRIPCSDLGADMNGINDSNGAAANIRTIKDSIIGRLCRAILEMGAKKMSEGMIENDSHKFWRGVRDVTMIWHGAWSDPELKYKNHVVNYYAVEDTLWDEFKDDCAERGVEPDEKDDTEFNKYCAEHADEIYMLINSLDRFGDNADPKNIYDIFELIDNGAEWLRYDLQQKLYNALQSDGEKTDAAEPADITDEQLKEAFATGDFLPDDFGPYKSWKEVGKAE